MLAVINDTGILVVVLAVVVLFGASRIPKLARSLGEANKEFRNATQDDHSSSPTQGVAPAALGPATPPARVKPADEIVTLSRRDLDDLLSRRSPSTTA